MQIDILEYTALMVKCNMSTKEIVYQSIDIKSQNIPENTTDCIMAIVELCNLDNTDDGFIFVDMYGYGYDDKNILWESDE